MININFTLEKDCSGFCLENRLYDGVGVEREAEAGTGQPCRRPPQYPSDAACMQLAREVKGRWEEVAG